MPIFLPIALVQGASPPAGVTENVVDFPVTSGVDMFANPVQTDPPDPLADGPAFTIALKMTEQSVPGTGLGYIAASGTADYFRIDIAAGRIGARIRDSAGTNLINNNDLYAPGLSGGEELAIIIAVSQTELKIAINGSVHAGATYSTANNINVPQYFNTRNAAAANSANQHYHGVWAANGYVDPELHWSDFFDANGDLTQAFFDGSAIQGVSPNFHQTGNAAAWNAMSGVVGEITDVPFDGGGSPPASPDITTEQEMRDLLTSLIADPTTSDGLTVTLAAGLDLTGIEAPAWEDALIDNPAQQIMTIRSADPSNPAILRFVGLESSVPGDGKVIGGVSFEDLRFDLTHVPLDVPEEDNNQAQIACLSHTRFNLLRRVRVKRCYFVGSNVDFRIDNREPVNRLIGMNFANCEDLEVSGNLFDLISTGGIIGGSDVLVMRNEFKRCNEDFWRISRPNIGGVGFNNSNYRVIENVFHDSWSRFRLHPDFIQIDDYHGSPHAAQQIEFDIDRNVVWLGDGMFCPVSPSGYGQDAFVMWDTLPVTMPMTNNRVNRVRQTTTGTTTLATGALEGTSAAVQLEARDALYEPITIEPGVGESFIAQGSGTPLASVTLIRPNQTVEFTMGAGGVITVQFYTCDNNMVQSNYAANKGTILGKIRNNIWATNGSISARLGSNWVAGSVANQNTMMQVVPGDVTGDGVPNTHADGFVDPGNNPKIVIDTANGSASGNIVNAVNNGGGGATANNLTVDWSTPSAVTSVFTLVTVENGGLKNFPTDLQDMVARALTTSAAATAAKQGAGWDDAGNAVDWTWTAGFGSGPDLALGNGSVVGGSGPQFSPAP